MDTRLSLILSLVALFCASTALLALSARPAHGQQGTVIGLVFDAQTGEGLAGANAVLHELGTAPGTGPGAQGFVAGTAADVDGRYRLQAAPGDYVLTVSYVGFGRQSETVTLRANETATLNVGLSGQAFIADVIVTASRRAEKVLDAPASSSIVTPREVEEVVAPTPVAALKNVVAVDETQTGLVGRELSLRGFTSTFTGSVFTLTDYRQAALPALGANAYGLMPLTTIDMERVEVVRGPAATLYGPGVTTGVIHFISKDPFSEPGTTVSVQGGERSVVGGEARHAGLVGERLGYKIVGTYTQGDNFQLDPERPENRALLNQEVLPRDYDFWKYAAYGSLVYKPSPGTTLSFDAGQTGIKSQFQTDLGTSQGDGYLFRYAQARLRSGNLFTQAFVNAGDAGDSFLYGTADDPSCTPDVAAGVFCEGTPQVNTSWLAAVQSQYLLDALVPASDVTVGVDLRFTRPESDGTLYGRFEDRDDVNEYGLYAQSTTGLGERLDLVLALRADYTNIYEEVTLTPRAGLVFKPLPEQTFRLTYNRAASSPTTNSLFIDLVALNAGGINVRALGNAFGYTYGRNPAYTALAGTDLVATSLLPSSLGQARPIGASLEEIYALLYGQIAAAGAETVQAALAAEGLPVDLATTEALLALLNPSATTVTGFSPGVVGFVNLSDPSQIEFVNPNTLADLEPVETEIRDYFEVGYRGVWGGRLLVGVDAFYEQFSNLVAPLALVSPFVLGLGIEADLAAALATGIEDNAQLAAALQGFGVTPEQAAELIVAFSEGAFAGPIGIVETEETRAMPGQVPELFLTFRNGGSGSYYGLDVATEWIASDRVNLFANASVVTPTFFDNDDLDSDDESFFVSANTTGFKVKGGASYFDPAGFSANVSVRYADGYEVRSGPYNGFVESYTIVDVGAGYAFDRYVPGLRLDVTVSNLLDNDHVQFIGAPDIGRLALARLTYDF